jgi:hypothetical protein
MEDFNTSDNPLPQDTIVEIMDKLPNDRGFILEKPEPERFHVRGFGPEELEKLDKQPLLHIVGMNMRAGVAYFANYLEHHHFPPDTPANDLMQFRQYKWNDFLWIIISIPLEYRKVCEECAAEAKLRLANGSPIMFGIGLAAFRPETLREVYEELKDKEFNGKTYEEVLQEYKMSFFPMQSDNVFTLENVRDHVIYEVGGVQDARIEETMKLKALWKQFGLED